MKDVFGTELHIGDVVATTATYRGSASLNTGVIESISKTHQSCVVRIAPGPRGCSRRDATMVVKKPSLTREKHLVEALERIAKSTYEDHRCIVRPTSEAYDAADALNQLQFLT
jgi:hypothetical protein